MRYEGHNGQITVDGDNVIITREGALAGMQFRKDTTWSVPLRALTGIRFKDATRLLNGHLRLLVLGQDPPAYKMGEGGGDEVTFTRKQRAEFAALHDWLQRVVDTNREQNVDVSALAVSPPPASRREATKQRAEDAGQRYTEVVAKNSGVDTTGALFTGTSRDSGRNAVVALYPDRIERVQAKSFASLSSARQGVEVTPVRAVSSVQTKKDGMMYTKVFVYASGNTIEFRFTHAEADRFKTIITERIVAGPTPAPAAAQPVDVADQLTKLAALKAQGILTNEEFAAQKAKLLS